MELPTAKSLPMIAIYGLTTALVSLTAYHAATVQQCQEERKADAITHRVELEACQSEMKDALRHQTAYLEKQDSINRSQMRAIEKMKRR